MRIASSAPPFRDGETEAQRGGGDLPRSDCKKDGEVPPDLQPSAPFNTAQAVRLLTTKHHNGGNIIRKLNPTNVNAWPKFNTSNVKKRGGGEDTECSMQINIQKDRLF